MLRAGILPIILAASLLQASAQSIEGLIVEVYHVNHTAIDRGPLAPPLPAGTVTYRIFLDLPPGHQVQAVYGDQHHPLYLGTTGRFYNDPFYGRETGDDIPIERLRDGMVALDSWVTVAYATDDHVATLKRNDPDGSILSGHGKRLQDKQYRKLEGGRTGLGKADGLAPVDTVIEVVQFGMDFLPMAFNAPDDRLANDTLLQTTNGAWGVLGGAGGIAPENHVLIAQLTTDGDLYFAFNVQVEAPDGSTTRWVWNDPGPGERQGAMLRSDLLPLWAETAEDRP